MAIQPTDLDFNDIKSRLKEYLRQQSEFSDYDFETSGLSNILDVLAYNTHINGLIANFALNESFLNTAQLRSSVVSHANILGYIPRSKTAARGAVNLSVTVSSPSRPFTISLPPYTKFSAEIDDVTYVFQTWEQYTATDDGGGTYTFVNSSGSENIEIIEGTIRTKTFLVGEVSEEQVYVIPDDTIDTSTIKVNVYQSATSDEFDTYTSLTSTIRIDSTSKIYQVKEAPNGFYEIIFGDGSVLGQSPVAGNKIVITYISTSAGAANGASIFSAQNDVDVDGTDYTLNTSTVTAAAGGNDKETIASIKKNASIAFASQQRMITAEDYRAQILANYSSYVRDVAAWGGQDNVPPVYGRVYVGLKFVDGLTASQQQSVKDSIVTNLTNNLAIMSIDTVFSDPETLYLELNTFFDFDPNLTNITAAAAEVTVQNTINNYFANNLNTFDAVFRRSKLLTVVDNTSPAILDSRMNVRAQLRITPVIGSLTNYYVAFPMEIADPDDVNYVVESSRFTYRDQACVIRNTLKTNTLHIENLASGSIILDNIGSYDAATGVLQLISFNPESIVGEQLKLSVLPANQATVRPLRNYIINIDTTTSYSRATIDYQNTKASI